MLSPPIAAIVFDWFREPASTGAASVDSLFFWIYGICLFFFFLIIAMMVAFMVRYCARPGHREEHTAHHSNLLEATWSIIPTIIVGFLFIYGFVGYIDLRTPPDDAYEIEVIAKKWAWAFRYPNGYIDTNLHVPVDEDVKLVMYSEDVIHSLFIPAFRVKMDVVPGRYSTLWFNATKANAEGFDKEKDVFSTGSDENGYDLFCTEYCGQGHSTMVAKVVVHESGTFDTWMEEAMTWDPEESPVARGKQIWKERGCAQCHSIDGAAATGPTWKGVYGTEQATDKGQITVDENYIRESILNPMAKIRQGYKGVMPSFQGQLKENELAALVWYIKSLNPKDGVTIPKTWTEVGGVPGQEKKEEAAEDSSEGAAGADAAADEEAAPQDSAEEPAEEEPAA